MNFELLYLAIPVALCQMEDECARNLLVLRKKKKVKTPFWKKETGS
tara:strand:+ start:1871 stop:2008 length:138 start_codon:yes stop_codon:yes gene_type:complete